MTNLFSKAGLLISKRALFFLGFLFVHSAVNAQLDSVSVSISFSNSIVLDSLQQSNDTIDILNVAVYTDDIDFLGEILVTVYDQISAHPIAKIKSTKAELLSLNAINGSTSTIEFSGFPPVVGSYRIDVLVRNFQGGNLPMISTTY